MDKNVYNMKAEKIQKFVKQGDYESAEKLCDTIEWNQVRSARMLSLVSSVYEHTGKYDKAIDILLMAYEEAPVGRRLLYKLTELALAAKEIRDAEDYYKTYLTEAPDDNSRYILRYKIAEAKNEPIEKKISILEAYKRQEFDEQWAYKLAELYALTGQGDKCAKLCDEIILWFGVGTYVDKALELKERFAPLTEDQLNHRNNRAEYEENLKDVQREYSDMDDIPEDIAAVLARGVIEETPHTPEDAKIDGEAKAESAREEIPEVAIADSMPAATESGQALTSLDRSAFLPEDEEVRMELPEDKVEEIPFASTRRINAKSDFAKTRVYDRQPGDETRDMTPISDEQIALAAAAASVANDAAKEPKAEDEAKAEPFQEELTWEDIQKFEPAEKFIFVGTNYPSEAVDIAIEKIKESHETEGTKTLQITKIPASKLNSKGVINSLEALKGKDLIILGASALDDVIVEEIKKVTEMFDPTKFFVMADSIKGAEAIKARFNKSEEVAKAPAKEPEVTEEIPEFAVDETVIDVEEEIPDIKLSDYFYDIDEMIDEQNASAAEGEAETEDIDTEPETKEAQVETAEPEAVKAEEPLAEQPAAEPVAEQPAEPAKEVEEAIVEPEEEISIEEIEIKISEEEPAEEATEEPVEEAAEEPAEVIESNAKGSMSVNDFMVFIKEYMEQIDCVYDKGAEESVRKYVESLAKENELLDTSLAVDMVEDAADQAEKHSLGNMFKSKYDKEGHLILRGKNFE